MRGADLVEAGADGPMSQVRFIAIAAQMPKEDLRKLGSDDLRRNIGSSVVAEVAMTAKDSLLHAPGTFYVILEELHVVIGFQDENIGLAHTLDHELGGMAQVSEKTDLLGHGPEKKANGIVSVMGNAEGVHDNVSNLERCSSGKDAEIKSGLKLALDSFLGEAIAVKRHAQLRAERAETLDMVAMLVSDQDAREGFRSAAECGKALADLAAAKASIDQNASLVGFQIGTIATGTAAENRKLHCHGATLGNR